MRQGEIAAVHRLHVCGLHLRQVLYEQELAEMVVDARALQVLAGAQEFLFGQRLAPHPFMDRGTCRPGCTPFIPRSKLGGDVFEIGERHSIGDEAWRPMMYSRSDA